MAKPGAGLSWPWALPANPAVRAHNASWHRSQAVQHWLHTHNQLVKQSQQGVRLVVCRLPSRSPWFNPLEPKWVHGKRAVLEPERVLTAAELQARGYAYYGCQPEPPTAITQKAA